jgi:hypothetical protein
MLHVDNSGKGNCMYYAYSISLMYFLRAQRDRNTTEDIFTKLKLKDDDKISLRTLLAKKRHIEFTHEEIETIIEPILGKATRNLAAEHTKNEFNTSPESTPLFANAQYGFEYCFKVLLHANRSELASLIDHEFTNPDYTEAEIYRVLGMQPAMGSYVETRLAHVVEEFTNLWAVKEHELRENEKPATEHSIKLHKTRILDKLIARETIDFFLADNSKHLNEYTNHIQRQFVWGTEETLFVLHRAIQGEHFVRNPEGRIEPIYDHEILLHLHRNGNSPFPQPGNPQIIMNNQHNAHWTSKIPDAIFSPKPTVSKKTYPGEITHYVRENKQTGPRVAKALRQMYQEGLEGNAKYSPENCKEIAQRYLDYVKFKNRHFNLTDVKLFLKELDEIIQKNNADKLNTLAAANRKPVAAQDKPKKEVSHAVESEVFTPIHRYSEMHIDLLLKTIYDWADSLTDNSFRILINSALKKYEEGFLGQLSARRSVIEGYLQGNTSAKALALIFINENNTIKECLFAKIIMFIRKEIARDPQMLHDEKYKLIAEVNMEEDMEFYLSRLKDHPETTAAIKRELESALVLTC